MINPHIQLRHRVARVGQLLVEGPFSIRPPRAIDDYGWLECDLRLACWAGEVAECAAVYVDDSMNRADGFLPPVIRHVRWDQGEDLRRAIKGKLAWPTAAVTLSYFEETKAEVDAIIQGIQGRLAALPFVPFGLSTDRSVPAVPSDERGRILVYSRNGVQSVEFSALTSGDDGGLTESVLGGIRALRALLRPIDLEAGWRESFPFPLTAPELGSSRWWDYRPPAPIAPSA